MPVIRTCTHCQQKNRVAASRLANTGRCGACKNPLPALSAPLATDPALFDEIVREARVPVLVDFWAEWCGPCRSAAPEVERTAADMAGKALVLKVDTEAHPQLSARFHVRGIPNFVCSAEASRCSSRPAWSATSRWNSGSAWPQADLTGRQKQIPPG